MNLPFLKLNLKTRIVLIIQAIGMLMGSFTHISWVISNGFISEKYPGTLFSKVFWDSLTFLDPLSAILLIFKPKAGIWMVLFIIVFDVVHNNIVYFDELYLNGPGIMDWVTRYWMILGQILFCIFVLSTFKSNLSEIRKKLD